MMHKKTTMKKNGKKDEELHTIDDSIGD